MTVSVNVPDGWDAEAHRRWLGGARHDAVQATLGRINALGPDKPAALVLQLSYYLFLLDDYRAAAAALEHQHARMPDHHGIALNLAVCLSRLDRHAEAVAHANALLARDPDDMVALDILSKSLQKLGREAEASAAGTRSLEVKDRRAAGPSADWRLPGESPRRYARRASKRDVIAFSLWGAHPRYLRGALQNALLAKDHAPGWVLRFHVDDTVPSAFAGLLRELGAEVSVQPPGQSLRQKLCWRFAVANDPAVGHFLVRDTDSVLGPREARAVSEWLGSDAWFHVMRDWWTHTDLMLAGMWGGVAGVLPPLPAMLAKYSPEAVETPNVDQWFLRDRVWGYVRRSCLVHDRCFRMRGSVPMPGPAPAGNAHVGQDEYAVRRAEQERMLRPWIARHRFLGPLAAR